VTLADNTTVQLLLLKNPWAQATYSGEFNQSDPVWDSAEIRAQVPLSIEPRTAHLPGLILIPTPTFIPAL